MAPRLARQAVVERRPELGPAPVDAAAHGPQLDPEGGGDLLVGQALDVAQHDRRAVFGRQRLQRRLDVAVEMPGVERLGRV